MYLSNDPVDLEAQLQLLDNGQMPQYSGPVRFHRVWARNRRRLIARRLKKQRRRAARWLPLKKPTCRGPSSLQVLLAQIQSKLIFALAISLLLWFVLWYFGIWKYLMWLVGCVVKLFQGIGWLVNLFRNAPKIEPRRSLQIDWLDVNLSPDQLDRLKNLNLTEFRDTVQRSDPAALITALETATYAFFTEESFDTAQQQILGLIDEVQQTYNRVAADSELLQQYGDLAKFIEPPADLSRPLARRRRDDGGFSNTISKFHDLLTVVQRIQPAPNGAPLTTTASPGKRVGGAFPYTW